MSYKKTIAQALAVCSTMIFLGCGAGSKTQSLVSRNALDAVQGDGMHVCGVRMIVDKVQQSAVQPYTQAGLCGTLPGTSRTWQAISTTVKSPYVYLRSGGQESFVPDAAEKATLVVDESKVVYAQLSATKVKIGTLAQLDHGTAIALDSGVSVAIGLDGRAYQWTDGFKNRNADKQVFIDVP